MQVRGIAPILGAISALIVWAAHFLLVYGTQATLCQRGLAGTTLAGQPMVPALVLGLTALGLLLVAGIGLHSWLRLRGGLSGEAGEDEPQFMAWLTAAAALLAALAMVWEAIPALLLHPCA